MPFGVRRKPNVEFFPVDPAVTCPTEGDTIVHVKAKGGIFGKRHDVMSMDGLASLGFAPAELAGELVPASYCI